MDTSKKLFDLEKLITLRRDIHKHPELAFNENETAKKVINYLSALGIDNSCISRKAKTGIVVDIKGKGKESGKPFTIAFRADMDALPMKEDNPHLDYCSINENAAHMCGHDGHVTCLLGGVSRILEHWEEIPSDKTLRLLFQPAEEAPILGGGAKPMIEEGCLDNVNEVYAFHNTPRDALGALTVIPGPMLAETNTIQITIIGKGGHAMSPEVANDPLQRAVDFLSKVRELTAEYKEKNMKFVFTIPTLHVGETHNVIAEKAFLKGTFRSFDHKFTEEFKSRVQSIMKEIESSTGCTFEMDWVTGYPVTVNAIEQTEIVTKVAKKVYGESNISTHLLPAYGAEDFSYYLQKVPGCMFNLGTWDKSKNSEALSLHNLHYNFNDDAIPQASEMWMRLAEDRFGLKF
jgi:hippurate hydrolase